MLFGFLLLFNKIFNVGFNCFYIILRILCYKFCDLIDINWFVEIYFCD